VLTTPRAGAYARISVHDENVPKVENQLTDLRRLVKNEGYDLTAEIDDDGLSAPTPDARPGFDRLIDRILQREFDVILATEEARFARNTEDLLKLQAACIATGTTWHTVREGKVDLATASGVLMSNMRGAWAQYESMQKGERQKAANAHVRARGLPARQGVRPFGWQEDRLHVREDEAGLVRDGTSAILAGHTLNEVTRAWRASGVCPPRSGTWGRISVRKVLTRWRNAGVVSHYDEPDHDIAAQWEPIVSREDLETCRVILLGRGGKKREPSYLCTSIARCGECGETMMATGSNGRPSYQCSAKLRGRAEPGTSHPAITIDQVDGPVRRAIIDLFFSYPTGILPTASEDLQALHSLHERKREAQHRITKAQEGFLADGFSAAELSRRRHAELRTIERLDRQIEEHASRSAHMAMAAETWAALGTPTTMDEWVDARRRLYDRFDALDLSQRRSLVETLLTVTVNRVDSDAERVLITVPPSPWGDEDEAADSNPPTGHGELARELAAAKPGACAIDAKQLTKTGQNTGQQSQPRGMRT
jgi:DNA invertase Pin-like site-specific DNA recombinase